MFVDHIKIHAKAGDGGNGKVSFRRAKFIPKGGPDGGDGGNGGDVVLQVDHHTDNLKQFFFQQAQKASPGVHGGANRRTGKSGRPLVLKVPQGTMVYRDAPPPHRVRVAAPRGRVPARDAAAPPAGGPATGGGAGGGRAV